MSSPSASVSIAGNAAPSRLLYWALVAAVACPMRFEFSVGPFSTFSLLDLALVACSVYFTFRLVAFMPVKAGPPWVAAAVLTPAVLALASVLWTADPTRTAAASIKYASSALLYFVALQFGANLGSAGLARTALVILVGWLAGSAAMYFGLPGFAYFMPSSAGRSEADVLGVLASVYTRLGHPYVGQSNDYAPLLALLGFILLGCGLAMRKRWALAASGFTFVASALTFSRGVMGGVLIALAAFVVMARPSSRQLAWFLAAPAIAAIVVLAIDVGQMSIVLADRELEVADVVASRLSEANVTARVEGYRELLEFISDRPWLGYGAGYYDRSHPEGLVSAHNAFLEQWKYFGVVLGTLSIACYIIVMIHFFRLRRWIADRSLAEAFACAWLCLVISSMVETFFEATTPRAVIYFVLGLCVSVCAARVPARAR